MKLGPWIIIKRVDYPAFEKAHKLARCLSLNDIEEILAGKKHLHGNPVRKQKVLFNIDGQKIYEGTVEMKPAGEGGGE